MSFFKNSIDNVKKSIIKKKVKDAVNDKLSLEGKHDEKIDDISNKLIDKVGVDNILKAKKIIDTIKS
ncbi:hypothetical protein FM038_019915 [Shewanella eurypsychrophilus]|uniref:Uncharacterized protein n=1 Tax=Shewanella eurypsychrophilus TaxID=2593656 RepID=A0ABX6VBW8_9GAMM|nr:MULTISPECIES: hypothetical protein [Shewanella]QFU24191.1 hypothetical protein FS418_21640 [Shewanella sp. YLB-09]QPG59396.1 hypothetical protein FM038_019915 [Shewanella eurypsychrophilus]